jgi:hypothetical protein
LDETMWSFVSGSYKQSVIVLPVLFFSSTYNYVYVYIYIACKQD